MDISIMFFAFLSQSLAVTLITKLLWVCTVNFEEYLLSLTKPFLVPHPFLDEHRVLTPDDRQSPRRQEAQD